MTSNVKPFSRESVQEAIDKINFTLKDRKLHLSILESKNSAWSENSAVVANAFMDYELYKWMMEGFSEKQKRDCVEFFARIVQRICCANGFVVVVKDENGRICGSASFEHRKPSRWLFGRILQGLGLGLTLVGSILFGSVGFPWVFFQIKNKTLFLRRLIALDTLEKYHSIAMDKLIGSYGEHMYLIQLATNPSLQSRGVGSLLLQCLGSVADYHKLYIYLETDTDRLKSFYERNGFVKEVDYVLKDKEQNFEPNFGMVRHPNRGNEQVESLCINAT